MKNLLCILKPCMHLSVAVFFLSGCSQSPEEIIPKVYSVEISQMQFQPSQLTLQKGDTVVFVNKDLVVHDVTEETNKAWTSSPLQPGQSYRVAVTQSADYYCSIHPVMKGRLMVQ